MCDEWKEYATFEKWALENGYHQTKKQKAISIERLNNDGDYCPENCVWTTPKVQMNNTRKNVFVEYKGQRKTLAQWAETFGMCYSTFLSRYSRGWEMERIEKQKVRSYGEEVGTCLS